MPIIDAAELLDPVIPQTTGPKAGPAGSSRPGTSSRTTGVRERRDKTPKTSATRKPGRPSGAERTSSETAAIGEALGQLLSMPGAVFGMIGEPFLGDTAVPDGKGGYTPVLGHFGRTGPSFGMQLAKASETNPGLRRILRQVMGGDSFALLLLGAVTYAGIPLVYLLTPNHSPIRHTLGVPDRPRRTPDPGPDPFVGDHADTEEAAGDE